MNWAHECSALKQQRALGAVWTSARTSARAVGCAVLARVRRAHEAHLTAEVLDLVGDERPSLLIFGPGEEVREIDPALILGLAEISHVGGLDLWPVVVPSQRLRQVRLPPSGFQSGPLRGSRRLSVRLLRETGPEAAYAHSSPAPAHITRLSALLRQRLPSSVHFRRIGAVARPCLPLPTRVDLNAEQVLTEVGALHPMRRDRGGAVGADTIRRRDEPHVD